MYYNELHVYLLLHLEINMFYYRSHSWRCWQDSRQESL